VQGSLPINTHRKFRTSLEEVLSRREIWTRSQSWWTSTTLKQ